MQDLQLDWLRAFVAVVDAGSLTAAAPLVHRSQSALSMQIKKLEAAVGRAVLTRGPRHLQLTPAGSVLLGHARRMVELHAEAMSALHDDAITGTLTLGVPDDYAASYLTPVLRSFATRHAGVEITLVCEQSTVLIPKVTRGEIDLALVTRDRAGRGTFVLNEPLVWVGAAQHEAWRRDPLPIALYESGSRARKDALAALRAQGRAFRIVCNSSSLPGHVAAVQSGLAVAVLTRCSVPVGLVVLGGRQGLPDLPSMEVVVLRSQPAKGSPAVDTLYQQMLSTLKR